MFWRMTGLSTTSPVDTILEKENFTLEELLDEDEIIQECKALNTRLINFLRERWQVEQLLRYIIEEPPENAEKKRTFKFPFIACEIFTCEVDILLRALVEDGELMDLLFSFLKPDRIHSTLLAGYFSKVVICLMVWKTSSLMAYVQGHPEIIHQLVDLIGITSIMEVLVRLIGADENMYTNYMDTMQSLEGIDVLELIVDKFSSSDSPEVHANAAEILCAVTRYAPPTLATKICSPSFVERLFRHALEESRPKSVLIHSLSVCISLLDPKRLVASSYQVFRSQLSHGSLVTATPETVEGMLQSLGELLKLLDISASENSLPTTYGHLQPPLGKHRLKIVEFISVLLSIGSEAAEKEVMSLGAITCAIDLFFKYPFNNFLHHHLENIVGTCLESKKAMLIEHLLNDCNIISRILEAEKQSSLSIDTIKPTLSAEGRTPPRIGNVGHMTRIANKFIQMGNNSSTIQIYLQENSEWVDWQTNVLQKRNFVENVYNWTCGRPTSLHDRGRDSDDDDFRDRDYDVASLASNLSQAFQVGIYSNDDVEKAQGSFERDDEDVYFDDESAEVVISSLRLGDDQDSSLFTNSNWFAFENGAVNERATGSLTSSLNSDDTSPTMDEADEAIVGDDDDDKVDSAQFGTSTEDMETVVLENGFMKDLEETNTSESEKPAEWVEWRETSESNDVHELAPTSDSSNGLQADEDVHIIDEAALDFEGSQPSSCNGKTKEQGEDSGGLSGTADLPSESLPSESLAGTSNGDPHGDLSKDHEGIDNDLKVELSNSEAVEDNSGHLKAVEN